MGWIKDRIEAEYKKHYKSLDWTAIAEAKIRGTLKHKIKYWNNQPTTDEFSKGFEHCCKAITDELKLTPSTKNEN